MQPYIPHSGTSPSTEKAYEDQKDDSDFDSDLPGMKRAQHPNLSPSSIAKKKPRVGDLRDNAQESLGPYRNDQPDSDVHDYINGAGAVNLLDGSSGVVGFGLADPLGMPFLTNNNVSLPAGGPWPFLEKINGNIQKETDAVSNDIDPISLEIRGRAHLDSTSNNNQRIENLNTDPLHLLQQASMTPRNELMDPILKHSHNYNPGIILALHCDDGYLQPYQALIRKQLEFFVASKDDVQNAQQGRKKPPMIGQVGIRCRHCAPFSLRKRGKGAVYFPKKLENIYQASQNMAKSHLFESCSFVPEVVKAQLSDLRRMRRDAVTGGKQYWARGATVLGLEETEHGIFFKKK